MKVIIILFLIMILIQYSLIHVKQRENLYLIKVFIYYIMSSIHSIFIDFPFPLGGLLCILIYMHARINQPGKRFAIILGLFTFMITAIPTYEMIKPFKAFYLYVKTNDIQEINVYSVNLESEKRFLWTITNDNEIKSYIDLVQNAVPLDDTSPMYQPYGNMMVLHCKLSNMDTTLYIEKDNNEEMLYLGKKWIPYKVHGLYDLIFRERPHSIQRLIISDQNNIGSIISDPYLMNRLWDSLPWLTPVKNPGIKTNLRIQFQNSNDTFLSGFISSDFAFLSMDSKTYKLSYHLSKTLYDHYLLNRLKFQTYNTGKKDVSFPHQTTIESDEFIFSIDPMEDSPGYGIYKTHKINKKKELILSLQTNDIIMQLIRDQYLLLYIESDSETGDILLVKTSAPYSKRYIESEKKILPTSFDLSPDKKKLAYLIEEQNQVSLKVINDIYREPKELIYGNIHQIKWISSNQIVFVNALETGNRLVLYNTLTNYISYVDTINSIQLLTLNHNKLTFKILAVKNNATYVGVYELDEFMKIVQIE